MSENVIPKSSSRETLVSPRSGFLKRHPLVAYFVSAFIISWLIWGILGVAPAQGWLDAQFQPDVVLGLGAFGPMLAALIVTGASGGAPALRELVGRILRWRVGIKWFLIALLGMPALFGIAVVFLRISGGRWPDVSQHLAYPALGWVGAWLLFVLLALGEEVGWRGFALPGLQKNRSALSATLILGVFWAIWHIPVFFFHPGLGQISETGAVGPIFWVIGILTQAVLYTWLYNSARGSILMVILLHAGLNTVTLGGGENIAAIVGGLALLAAVIIVVVFRRANLSRSAKQTLPTQ